MASQPIPITHLNLEPQVVKCPACQHVGKSIRVMDTISNSRATASALLGILACLSCNCTVMTAPTYYFIGHYCSGCGIRFSVVPWYDDPVPHLDRSVLVDAELVSDQKGALGRIAPSPHGLPPPVSEQDLRGFASRFSTWTPSLVLVIDLKGLKGFPGDVFDASGTRKLYEITWPGAISAQGTHPYPVEYTPMEPMKTSPDKANLAKSKVMTVWDPTKSTPHIRVSSTGEHGTREIATAQVFPLAKDYILHTPRHLPDGSTAYTSRRTGIKGQLSQKSRYMVWNSCSGPLTWIVRSVCDKELATPSRRIVLMDAYDRLVGMLHEDGEGKIQLRLYPGLESELVGEILASFSALSYVIWNYAQLTGSDEGWGVVDAGVNIAGLGAAIGM